MVICHRKKIMYFGHSRQSPNSILTYKLHAIKVLEYANINTRVPSGGEI